MNARLSRRSLALTGFLAGALSAAVGLTAYALGNQSHVRQALAPLVARHGLAWWCEAVLPSATIEALCGALGALTGHLAARVSSAGSRGSANATSQGDDG